MSQASAETTGTVDRLKELLFDTESRALDEIARRLDDLARSEPARRAELEAALKAEVVRVAGVHEAELRALSEKLEGLFARAGTDERLRASVAEVLDGAIHAAEQERHQELSAAMAPLVVRTIKTEIRNSQDELVEALYPITGRMVKAYVASAMKDLMDQVNRKLESNPLMLRIRSLTTGRSVAELALAETQSLEVEELLLIRRGSGELLSRWPEGADPRDHVMGGILSAINSFAVEALGEEGSALREIDLGEARLYLRASPVYLLAAKCKGSAPPSIEEIIDDEFLATIEAQHRHSADAGEETDPAGGLLAVLSERLEQRISDKQAEIEGMPLGIRPGKALAWMLGLAVLGWLGWSQLDAYETNRVRAIALEMIETTEEVKGYPNAAVVGPRGRELTVTGLAPTEAAKLVLMQRLDRALPSVRIIDRIAIVPNSAAAIEPEIERVRRDLVGLEAELTRRMVQRASERAHRSIEASLPELRRLSGSQRGGVDVARSRAIIAAVEKADRELSTIGSVASAPAGEAASLEALARPARAVRQSLAEAADGVAALLQPGAPPASRGEAPVEPLRPVLEEVEAMASEAGRLAAVTVALAQAQAAIDRLPPPPVVQPPPAPPPRVVEAQPTPRQLLEDFTRTHAVFFSDGIEYRDDEAAAAKLDELARLMQRTEVVLRIVGYTDDRGAQSRNSALSLDRAQKVRDALVTRGIAQDRLIAIGRPDGFYISPQTGTASPNRRVQFEIGFAGEASP